MEIDPKNILIILHGSIGDVTRALPLAPILHAGFPRARLSWAVEPACFPLVQNDPALDEVILFDRRSGWLAFGPFLKKVRSRRFDLVLDLQRHLKSGLISRWSGAPYRLGFDRADCKEFNWLFNNHFIAPAGEGVSKLQHYLKFAEHLGLAPCPIEWNFQMTPEETTAVERLVAELGPEYAVLFAGSRWESKRWFCGQIVECAERIHKELKLDVVLIGGREDRDLAQDAMSKSRVSMISLVGRTSLRQAVGVLAGAQVAVGPDTGLMHLAAALGTPVVSLWGATSPARTGPFRFEHLVVQGHAACSPCYMRRCPIDRICMQSIDMNEVTAKIRAALSRGGSEEVMGGGRA